MSAPAAAIGGTTGEGTALQSRRLRADLQIHPRERSGRRQYWLSHPISGRIVRLAAPDFHALADAENRPRAADPELIAEAEAAGLIADRRQPRQSRRRASWWQNPLYIRLPGIPADRVARFLAARTSWLFSPWAVRGWCLMILVVAIALLVHGRRLAMSLDPLVSFQAKHWGIVLATLAITKMIHELAHAAVCRRMGAAAREIGLLLLCGTPCLYCDVTDSWRVESRLRRAAIMLAGVYIELVLAAIAGLIWMLSDDGLQRMMALNVICVCGVSTVVFNLNPLMRYDGYFVLADFLDVPNLRSRAAEAWRWTVVRRLAGEAYETAGRGPAGVGPAGVGSAGVGSTGVGSAGRGGSGLATYHAASAAYRYVVLAALGGWFYIVISRAGLEPLGRAAIAVVVVGVAVGRANQLRGIVAGHGGWLGVSRRRRWALAVVGLAIAGLLLFVPVDRRVTARGVVELHGAAKVYAPRRGRVESVAREFGSRVDRGAALARLDEPALRIERVSLASQSQQLQIRRASLKRRALWHPEVLDQLEEQTAAITATENQLHSVETAIDQMTLVAPRGGTILPYVDNPQSAASDSDSPQLVDRLAERLGQTIEAGSIWCCIGDASRKQVILEVDASRRRFVEAGGQVQVQFDQSPAQVVTCEVMDVSAMRHQARGLAELAPSDRFTVACLLPENVARRVRIGATATAVIRGEPLRLWDWCTRQLTGSAF